MPSTFLEYVVTILPFLALLVGVIMTTLGFIRKKRALKIVGFTLFFGIIAYLGYITWIVLQIDKMD